ncbi:hypothetical protein HY464_00425 [Candidatus Peregrinibacteria bacterium]|nr:hypothetical protein [Candidatus Peregrinibacteria bacterium]
MSVYCLWQPQHIQVVTDEWVFEKYFEDRGNGVFHIGGSDVFESSPNGGPRDDGLAKISSPQEFGALLGHWRSRHPELRIVVIVDVGGGGGGPPSLIIVTEHR